LFSSHVLTEVEQVCDRVVIINKGKVVAQGTASELSQQFMPQRQLYIELDGGNQEAYQRLMNGLDNVQKVEPQGRGFVLHVPSDDNLQKPITRVIADSDFTLIEMRQLDVSLEDVFLDIINKGEL